MGQQQLLLLVLSTIIVGVSIVVGIGMFQDSAMNANIDTVTQECVTIASKASEWFNKSTALAGGNGDFTDLTLEKLGYSVTANDSVSNETGQFGIVGTASGTSVGFAGLTKEVDDTNKGRIVTTTLTMDAINGSATIVSVVSVQP